MPKESQAIGLYVLASGWSGGQETDGRIPNHALGVLHGSPVAARLLVKYDRWTEQTTGWNDRQLCRPAAALRRDVHHPKSRSISVGVKGNCIRHHGRRLWLLEDGIVTASKLNYLGPSVHRVASRESGWRVLRTDERTY